MEFLAGLPESPPRPARALREQDGEQLVRVLPGVRREVRPPGLSQIRHTLFLPPLFECTTRDVCSIASTRDVCSIASTRNFYNVMYVALPVLVTFTCTGNSYEYITSALFYLSAGDCLSIHRDIQHTHGLNTDPLFYLSQGTCPRPGRATPPTSAPAFL